MWVSTPNLDPSQGVPYCDYASEISSKLLKYQDFFGAPKNKLPPQVYSANSILGSSYSDMIFENIQKEIKSSDMLFSGSVSSDSETVSAADSSKYMISYTSQPSVVARLWRKFPGIEGRVGQAAPSRFRI